VLSVGLEWANFSANTAGDFTYAGYYYNSSFSGIIRRRFNGIGPVISWNASTPIGDPGCHLSLNWGAMGSVLFGPRKIDVFENGTSIDRRSKNATVPRLSAYFGVGWHPEGSIYALSAGYAISSTWGVFDGNFDDDGDELPNNVDRVIHGPYIDLTIQIK